MDKLKFKFGFDTELIDKTKLIGECSDSRGLEWDIRSNYDILGNNKLFVRNDHLGLVTETFIGKELTV